MKIVFAILLYLSAGFASSQTIINIFPPKNDKEDYKLEKLSDTAFVETGHSDDMGHSYGHYFRLKSNVPDGEYLIYFYNILELRAFMKNSKKDSVWTEYNSGGTPRSVTPYKNGLINGDISKFYNSGSLYSISRYVNNQISGSSITFYESGNIRCLIYYENGDWVQMEEYNEKGELEKVSTPK